MNGMAGSIQDYLQDFPVAQWWEGHLSSALSTFNRFLNIILDLPLEIVHFYKSELSLLDEVSHVNATMIAVRIYNIIMQIIKSNVDELRKLKPTKFIEQLFSLVIIVGSALALWKGLSVAFYTECPVVVVLSGSMEPGYYRGDILFVTNWNEPIVPGDVVVFSIPGQAIPIVHRVITNQEKADGDYYLLTKGDNNQVDDRGLYNQGNGSMKWIHKRHIMGKMRAYIPYVGFFTIALNDYVWFKYAVLGFMVFCVLVAKDPQN